MEIDKISYKNVRKETIRRHNLYNSSLYHMRACTNISNRFKNSSNSVIKNSEREIYLKTILFETYGEKHNVLSIKTFT